MKTFDEMDYHPLAEQLATILCEKTQNHNPMFFRVLVAYYFSMLASMMRCTINTPDRGAIPINLYAINLMASGHGKGHSTTFMEESVIHLFQQRFMEETFPLMAEQNLPKLALKRAQKKGTDPDGELELARNEFDRLGNLAFCFDSATTPAVKQLRHKLLMANAGAINLQMDEIGSNLLGNKEVLDTFLELYDKGLVKQKLTKNTNDNIRSEDIRGTTPTNMLLFGTPSNLLNGGKIEEEFYAMLETGYARRCFFGYSRKAVKRLDMSAEEIFEVMTRTDSNQFVDDLADRLERLADLINANKQLYMSKETSLLMIEYKLKCEREAERLPEHQEIRRAELSHRYFKALKLAGAYAFIDDSPELTQEHLYQAIKLAEACGESFLDLLSRDRPYVKLARYIASAGCSLIQPDLVEDLPFYRGSQSARNEMLHLAIAYGYKNNIIIKKSFEDGIEFLSGETLKETNLDEMLVAYSTDMTEGYMNERAPFSQLHKLTQNQGMHWVSHHLRGGYRNEENAVPGFNLLVIDVDTGISVNTAQLLLKDYKALYYTTKSSTPQNERFRILLPMAYELKLDAKDYKEFMHNVFQWLPFAVDESGNHRCKKWLAHNGSYSYTDGELFDPLPFIPKTSKNEERKQLFNSQSSFDNLERWVLNNSGDGNRNNMLLRYALILVDSGLEFEPIRQKVMSLNSKMPDKLDEIEIMGTIMITVGKAIAKRP